MIDSDKTRAWHSGDVRQHYTTKDCILYALGLGAGADPLDPRQLRFVYEKELAALPTMAAVLASPGSWMRERAELGIDFLKLVHGEQAVTLHAPLPPSAALVGRSRVTRLVDKGEGKGAVMHVEKVLTDEATGERLATCEQVLFLRGNGGFPPGATSDAPAPAPAAVPDAAPDLSVTLATLPNAAVLYRLSGDLNPLHIDPGVATRSGFPRPILHGLATWGMAGLAAVQHFCDGDPARLTGLRARLSSPVFPGETLAFDFWDLGAGELALRARVPAREVVVLSHGRVTLRS
ncbi:acyl dehydratase [Pseudacidovorax sp. 1753]|uniref:MaoC/PaaZ C-terminal domain-containing protein n=1 Tax=Pseudacidovorax sp. 1753 TaxID=3156419 RepID=UPI0033929D16